MRVRDLRIDILLALKLCDTPKGQVYIFAGTGHQTPRLLARGWRVGGGAFSIVMIGGAIRVVVVVGAILVGVMVRVPVRGVGTRSSERQRLPWRLIPRERVEPEPGAPEEPALD